MPLIYQTLVSGLQRVFDPVDDGKVSGVKSQQFIDAIVSYANNLYPPAPVATTPGLALKAAILTKEAANGVNYVIQALPAALQLFSIQVVAQIVSLSGGASGAVQPNLPFPNIEDIFSTNTKSGASRNQAAEYLAGELHNWFCSGFIILEQGGPVTPWGVPTPVLIPTIVEVKTPGQQQTPDSNEQSAQNGNQNVVQKTEIVKKDPPKLDQLPGRGMREMDIPAAFGPSETAELSGKDSQADPKNPKRKAGTKNAGRIPDYYIKSNYPAIHQGKSDLPDPDLLVQVTGLGGKFCFMHKEIYPDWLAMIAAIKNEINLGAYGMQPFSVFRDDSYDNTLWISKLKKALRAQGKDPNIANQWPNIDAKYDDIINEVRKRKASPGSSAHRTGRAIDLSIFSDKIPSHASPIDGVVGFSDFDNRIKMRELNTQIQQWLNKNAKNYGFINYDPEPWHWEHWTQPGGKYQLASNSSDKQIRDLYQKNRQLFQVI